MVAASALLVVFLVPAHATGFAPEASTFAFPFVYGNVSVPASIGAQGTQGATVPLASLGPVETPLVGPVGHLGPVNLTNPGGFAFHRVASTLEIQALNGTLHPASAVASRNARVTATNLTNGIVASGLTNAAGFVNLSVTEGWFQLSIGPAGSSFLNLTQELQISSASLFLVRYLPAVSLSTVTVSNGPAAADTGSVWLQLKPYWTYGPAPQLNVSLENASSGNAIIAKALTGNNGTAGFTHLDTAFTYNLFVETWWTYQTGLRYYGSNASVALGSSSGSISYSPGGNSRSIGGSISGTSPPAYGSWTLTAPTVITGSTLYVSDQVTAQAAPDSLTLSNDVVYWNNSAVDLSGNLVHVVNSTIVFQIMGAPFPNPSSLLVDHSVMIGAGYAAGVVHGVRVLHAAITSSILENFTATSLAVGGQAPIFGGNFANDTIANLTAAENVPMVWLNATNCAFTNVTFTGGGGAVGTARINTTFAFNSSFRYQVGAIRVIQSHLSQTDLGVSSLPGSSLNVSNSSWSSTFPWGLQVIGSGTLGHIPLQGTAALVHDNLSLVTPAWVPPSNFVGYYHSFPNVYTTGLPLQWNLEGRTNVSYSTLYFNQYPTVNSSIRVGDLRMFNDYILDNQTTSQLQTWQALALNNPPRAGQTNIEAANLTMNYVTDLGATDFWIGVVWNSSVTHTIWPWINLGETAQLVNAPSMNSNLGTNLVGCSSCSTYFYNDTFGAVYFNLTLAQPIFCLYACSIGFSYVFFGTGSGTWPLQSYRWGPVTFGWNTFEARMLGSGAQQQTSDLLLAQGPTSHIAVNVTHNLFENDPRFDFGPANRTGTLYDAPYIEDVDASAGIAYLTSNWFLRLNNETAPIGSNALMQYQGAGARLHLAGNRYFYSPMPGQLSVATNGPYLTNETTQAAYAKLSKIPSQSTMTFEIPVGANSTVDQEADGQYVFNTSVAQDTPHHWGMATSPPSTSYIGTPYLSPSWSWAVIPDAVPIGGILHLGYNLGAEGGQLPLISWKGYTYNVSIEPTYARVNASSASAPFVAVDFAAAAGALYQVQTYTASGQLVTVANVTASNSGNVTVLYYPGSGAGTEVFTVTFLGFASVAGGGAWWAPLLSWTAIAVYVVLILAVVAIWKSRD
ncbi:MAG TPA: hypothetical protein VGV89_10370 [Thermoplasmata archaeon]|nr:hypothetical protein [Thermoplasmata archaeon]